ncbi:MAG: glycerol acyltransferase [Armatimonadota bacterium]
MPQVHTPKTFGQRLATRALGMLGWKAVLEPPPGPKFVAVGYPHTSNWDFLYAILWKFATGQPMNWVGKKELFPPVLAPLMKALGGIPLDRRKKGSEFVSQVAELIRSREAIVLVVAAEGTRSRAEYWRSGFYYMALGAQVPIALGYLDYARREVGIGAYLWPSGDIRADFDKLRAFYADKVGKKPENAGPVRLREEVPDLEAKP